MLRQPKLTLVGAGPGDADLITVKGMKTLQQANAILYDALVDGSLLAYAQPGIPLVYVGKRKGHHTISQSAINELIVQYALTYGHIVRLKGGDPFVFGRGYEEIAYAQAFGIETDVVPGLSSTLAVPALAQIPVTSRGVAEGFWVVTASTKSGTLSKQVRCAAASDATVVLVMGMQHLAEIVEVFSDLGKALLPAAIIQNGSTPQQKMVTGLVQNLVALATDEQLGNPAIIVIGNVVALQHPVHIESQIAATKKQQILTKRTFFREAI